jgi:AhpD family alkylhydroperoxidase
VAPGGRREVGAVNWAVSRAAGLAAGTGPPNLFLTLGRNRALFRGWLRFAGRLMPGGSLARREAEMVILRVAHHRGCAYELEHHARLAARAGVDAAEVARLCGGPTTGWAGRERALLDATDALLAGDLPDATWDELRRHLDEAEAVELCLLVGHYDMLATVIAALRIQPDPPGRGRAVSWRRGRDARAR